MTKSAFGLTPSGKRLPVDIKAAKRRRPGDSQREQKELTRKRLLEAAQVVFNHNSYSDTAVEMVADQAGVSRTTFYRHFDGKLPLVFALFEEMVPRLKSTWNELFQMPQPTIGQVRLWLEHLVKESAMNQVLVSVFAQIEATEQDAHAHKFEYYADIWRLSGLDARLGSADRDDVRAKFLLLMLQVDQFLYLACSRNMPIAEERLVNAMADYVRHFLVDALSLAQTENAG